MTLVDFIISFLVSNLFDMMHSHDIHVSSKNVRDQYGVAIQGY